MRSITTIFSILLLLGSCKSPTPDARRLLDAVPLQTVVLLHFQNVSSGFEKFSGTAIAGTLDSLQLVTDWNQQLRELRGLLQQEDGRPLVSAAMAAIHLSGGDKYDVLWLVPAATFQPLQKIRDVKVVSERNYGSTKIITFQMESGQTYVYARYKEFIALSKSDILVEEAIKQQDAYIKITQDPLFVKAFEAANARDPIHLFIQLKHLPAFAAWGMPETGHHWMGHFASWVSLDVALKVDQLVLSGLVLFNDSLHPYLGTWQKNGARHFLAPEIFPIQTAAFVALTADNFPQQHRARQSFLDYHNKGAQYKRYQQEMTFDSEGFFNKHLAHEWGIFYAEGKSGDVYGNKFGYIAVKSAAKALRDLEGTPGFILIETYRETPIYRLGGTAVLPHTLGQLFWGLNEVYVVFHQNFVVFGSNYAQIKGLINDWQDGKTLSKDSGFKSFAKAFPSKGHIWAVAVQPSSLAYASSLFPKSLAKDLQKQADVLRANRWMGMHFRVADQAAFTHLVIKQEAEVAPDTRRKWTLALKAPLRSQPQLVTNHLNNHQEILVQDSLNNLYLIDGSGQLLWQKNIDGPILGKIHQVDLYKNNRLQLAFNTADRFYIVDRNGNDVAPFPIQLPGKATAGAGIFDYDNTRNYRLVIPVGDQLFNYGPDGREVSGWEKPRLGALVTQSPQHIRVGTFDYILVYTRGGQIRLLNRKGEDRVMVSGTFPLANKQLFLHPGDAKTEARLTGLTETGKLINIYFDGKSDSLDAGLGSAVNLVMSGDKFLLAAKRKLQLRHPQNPFEVTTPDIIEIGPYFFEFGETAYFGVGSASEKQIWVYQSDGKMLPGFPLYGSTPFVLGRFTAQSPLALVTGAGDGSLICYEVD